MHSENNTALLNALKSGDQKAFASVYQSESPAIFLKLLQIVKTEKIAEELLQELFIKLWLKKETIDIQTNLRGYLYTMAANIAFDYFRKLNREKQASAAYLQHFEQTFDPDALTAQQNDHTLLQELYQLIDKLPPQRKKVLELCKLQGKSYAEASSLLGISAATVNDHIVKATKTLRRQLLEKKSLSGLVFLLFYCC